MEIKINAKQINNGVIIRKYDACVELFHDSPRIFMSEETKKDCSYGVDKLNYYITINNELDYGEVVFKL